MEDSEKVQEREFYRYYYQSHRNSQDLDRASIAHAPDESLSRSTGTLLDPIPEESPFPFNDRALVAFAQLGALRLNARRCLISFFDRKKCYILAEAARRPAPESTQIQFEDGDMCWGSRVVPRRATICYHTVNMPFANDGTSEGAEAHVPTFVVNDLSLDERFSTHAAVSGPPNLRFYAGVPIRSPSGHNIGTYCVVDDKPRDDFSETDISFLREMATTVMRNLQMTRAADDHRRGEVMVRSLGAFAEGKASLDEQLDHLNTDFDKSVFPQDTSHQRHRRQTSSSPNVPRVNILDPVPISRIDSTGTVGSDTTSHDAISPSTPAPISALVTPGSEILPDGRPLEGLTKMASSAKTSADNGLSPELQAAFGRAASMILQATEADGAVFLNAKISTFGGMVDEDFLHEQSSEAAGHDKACTVLGMDIKDVQIGSFIGEAALKRLLHIHPHGQIFNFDEEPSGLPEAGDNTTSEVASIAESDSAAVASNFSRSQGSEAAEALLKAMLPKARSLVMYPLWDTHRDQCFASAMVWSCDPMRVFTRDAELSYLAAFSNSIMAEVARLDTKMADAAKGDFISSISHELRSPLHGILGTLGLLKLTPFDSHQMGMANTIETCGTTLLDTINHVLDYAKINKLTRGTSRRSKKNSKGGKELLITEHSQTNDVMALTKDQDMAVLTEEVLESCFAGYNFQKSATESLDTLSKASVPPVAVIVDISRSDNYVFRTQPGAWRRVLMNLFGNALKYTPAGFIRVKMQVTKATTPFTFGTPLLSMLKRPDDNPEAEVYELRLMITDSGIGMSEEYIKNRLFHSFAQENPLSQGTGLGLSIVKQIVENLGGDVEVRSEKGRGTKFTVCCPLRLPEQLPTGERSGSPVLEDEISIVRKRTEGMVVSFVGFDETGGYFPVKSLRNKNATNLTLKAFENLCREWFGMKLQRKGSRDPDIVVATETGAKYLRAQHSSEPNSANNCPVIVICQGAASASAQSTTAITVPGQIFECISQPCGPHKLAKALMSCLDRHANRVLTQTVATDSAPNGLNSANKVSFKENDAPTSPPQSPPETKLLKPFESPTRGRSRPPFVSSFSAPAVRSANSSPVKGGPARLRSLNCLAVDDNAINLRLLIAYLDKLGHTHVLATNGQEAFDVYKESCTTGKRLDAVLMDIHMPIMDGFEASRNIRAYERENGLAEVHIAALTGAADAEAHRESKGSGINDHLVKPVKMETLEVILNSIRMKVQFAEAKASEEITEKANGTEQDTEQGLEKQNGTERRKSDVDLATSENGLLRNGDHAKGDKNGEDIEMVTKDAANYKIGQSTTSDRKENTNAKSKDAGDSTAGSEATGMTEAANGEKKDEKETTKRNDSSVD